MGGVNQSIDLVEDTQVEVAMISFNGDPLVTESNLNPHLGAWLPNLIYAFVTAYIVKLSLK